MSEQRPPAEDSNTTKTNVAHNDDNPTKNGMDPSNTVGTTNATNTPPNRASATAAVTTTAAAAASMTDSTTIPTPAFADATAASPTTTTTTTTTTAAYGSMERLDILLRSTPPPLPRRPARRSGQPQRPRHLAASCMPLKQQQSQPPHERRSTIHSFLFPHRRSHSHVIVFGGRPSQKRRAMATSSTSSSRMQQQHSNTEPSPSSSSQHHRSHRRRHTTSVSEFWKLEALEQWNDFQNTFTNELHDADMGRVYFMDMQLTRSLSILPEDLTEFVQETTDWHRLMSDEELEQQQQQQEKVIIPFQAEQEPLLSPTPSCEEIFTGEEEEEEEGKMISSWDVSMGYVMLFVAVLAISSNGTALHLLYGVPPALKLFWRMTATALLLSFFVIKGVFWNGYTGPNMGHHEWMTFAMAVITFAAHTLLLYTAFEYTTIGNAVIYGNSQALLLIIGRAFLGHSVSGLEILGVIVAFTGAILCSRDSEQRADVEIDYDPRMAMLGDGLALLSSVAGVAYLTCAKAVRPHISVTLFMFLVMFFGSVCIFIYLILTGVPITWSRDPHTGLLGWFTMENNHFLIMLHIAVVCNFLGTMGFVRAMQFFDTIIIAVATLLEPMVASLIAHAFDVGLMPGLLGYFGNALVCAGTIAVVISSSGKGDDAAAAH